MTRTVPFMMLTQTILTLWYHHAGTAADDVHTRRSHAPWYRHKRHIAVLDMLIAFRRNRITAITAGQSTLQQKTNSTRSPDRQPSPDRET